MSEFEQKNPLGEKLVLSFFKLLQMVKIHQANNKLVVDTIADFRLAIDAICADSDGANLRVHRGRLYLNQERLLFPANLTVAANKLIDYLGEREIQGIRFYEKQDLSNDEIVHFIQLLNQSAKVKDPVAWLQVQLDTANYTWIEFLADQDPSKTKGLSNLAGGSGSHTEGEAPGEGAGGQGAEEGKDISADTELGKRRFSSLTAADLAKRTYAQVMASMARKTYSHALTSMLNMTDKFAQDKRVGIQKSKRVIQGMIEILTKDESVLLGMSTIRNYDDYTYTHSVNVAILAMCLARRLGLSRKLIEQVGLCGLFHDLGKVEVPINLIAKNAALTEDEFEQVKRHSLNSVGQIIRLNADHLLKSRILLPPFEHHLGVDLSGYPKTERTTPLSLIGRILAIADHYDAMTSSRSYRREPISPDKALKFMLEESGSVLDPIILKVFIEMMGIYPVGSLLVLDTKEIGLAAYTPPDAEEGRPVACLLVRGRSGKLKKGPMVNLADRNEKTGQFARNIVRCYHANDYGIQPANFLV